MCPTAGSYFTPHISVSVAWDGLRSQPSCRAGGSGRAGPGRHTGGSGGSEGGCKTGSSEDGHGQEKIETSDKMN